jgi:uncharacterized protein YprB with RNaseH-like and TPR domain
MIIMFDTETTGLNPYKSIVILIGIKRGDEIKQWKLWEIKDEVKMIETVIKRIIGLTATSKILHMVIPEFFVMRDEKI